MAPAVGLLVPKRGARRGHVAKLNRRGSSGDRSTGPEGRGGDRYLADRVAWVRSSRRLRQPVGPARTICTPRFGATPVPVPRCPAAAGVLPSSARIGAVFARPGPAVDRGGLRGGAPVRRSPRGCCRAPREISVGGAAEEAPVAGPRRPRSSKRAYTHRTRGCAIAPAAPGDGRDTCFVRTSSAALRVRRRRRGASAPRRGPTPGGRRRRRRRTSRGREAPRPRA